MNNSNNPSVQNMTDNFNRKFYQALVVGINKYKCRHLQNLRVPAFNARYIDNRLQKQFQVERLEKATRKQLKEEISNLFQPEGKYPDTALLYFSGYVLPSNKGITEIYLATSDSNSSQEYELGVSLSWLKKILQESPVEQQIIILDCCHQEYKKLHLNTLLPGNETGKDRFYIISFHKRNHFFLSKNTCSELTVAILNELKIKQEENIDQKILIQRLKYYEKHLRRCGDFTRICFGKSIYLLSASTAPQDINMFSKEPNNPLDTNNPYKGLAYFDYEDAKYFYGREKLTDELLEKVRENNFLAIMGATGSGKSSIIRAGLVYQIRQGEQISNTESWHIVLSQPGKNPLFNLAEALVKEVLVNNNLPDNANFIQAKVNEIINKYIKKGANGLKEFIEEEAKYDNRIVLIIDQFEEIFTLCETDEESKNIDIYLEFLLGALKQTVKDKINKDKFCLVIALRADFFGKCAERKYKDIEKESRGLARIIQQNLVAVTPMSKTELGEAIEGPAKEKGVNVDETLKKELVEDAIKEPGSLPLLQYALKEIWEADKKHYMQQNKDFTKLTNTKNISLNYVLEKHANNVYHKELKTDRERDIAKYIFFKLINLGDGTGHSRKKTLVSDLEKHSRFNQDEINNVKKILDEEDLITIYDDKIEDGTEVKVVNLVHDVLIRNWSELNHWLEEYRSAKQLKEGIEENAKKWLKKKKYEDNLHFKEELEDAEKFIEDYGDILQLNEDGEDFIEKYKQHSQEKKRYRIISRIIRIIFIILLLILTAWIIIQNINTINNRNQELKKQSNSLISYSKTLFNENQQFDALIEGLRATIPLTKRKIPFPKNVKPVPFLRQAIEGVKERNRLQGHVGTIYDIEFSPDGKTLVSGGLDKTIRLWDSETGKEKTKNSSLKSHKRKVYNVSFNPKDKNQFASSSADGTIRIWTLEPNEENKYKFNELPKKHKGKVYSLSYSSDGQVLASSSLDKTIRLWNPQTGEQIRSPLTGHTNKVYSIDFNPQNTTQLASGSTDGTVRLWDTKTGENRILSNRNYNVDSISFSPDGKKLASGSADGTVHIWNLEAGTEFNTRNRHKFSTYSVIFSPDSKTLASAGFDNTIKLWDVATGKEITTITGHKDWVYEVTFNPLDNTKLASSSADGTIRIWDISKVQSITTLVGHQNWVNSVVFNPQNNTQLASASVDGTIKLWDINTGKKRELPTTKHKRINSISFSSDGKTLASSNADGSIQLWDTQTRKEIKPSSGESLAGHENWVNSVSFNPQNDTELVSGSNDETIKVWNIKTGEQKYIKKGRSEFDAVSFSFDGETIAAASFDNTIKLWDAQTGENNRTLKGHNNKVSSISFSRDNKLLASASYDKTVKIWNLETGKVKYTFDGHTAKVESVSFSPNGKIVASGSADKTIKLWDVITGKEIKTFAGHKSDVLTLRFNSNKDNPILASGSADEKIILWKIPSQDQIALAENVNLKSLISQGCEWTHDYLENNSNVPENDKHLCDDIDSTPMFEINGFDNNLIQHFVWNQLLSAKKSILQILNYFVQNKLS
ncbi:MAG: hypothetical protein AAFQ91_10835 [Cyanobacteria bacterium J06621_15]